MSTPNLEDTAPISTNPETEKKSQKPRRWPWILVGILLVLVGVAAGAWAGYNNAILQRQLKQQNDIALKAATQFQLGLVDQQSGKYEIALKRFEYVIQLDPKYPGAAAKMAEVMIAMAATTTPTIVPPTPTVTITPTPDTRGEQDLFNAARQALVDKKWDQAIQILDSLRKLNLTYQAIQVDGMYYIALRNRGMDKIRQGQLEEGMYDMSLTERFGPLDKEADTYRTWARLYVTGASFWQLDWVQVLNYFSQIYAAVPMLRDGSGMTAADRYQKALVGYAEQLVSEEKWCDAEQQYALALQVSQDTTTGKRATEVYRQCHPATATGLPVTPTSEFITPIAPTPELTQVSPTSGASPTPEPSSTPAPPSSGKGTPTP